MTEALPSTRVTLLLRRLSEGDQNALAELMPLMYDELHSLASSYLRRERPNHTLQTTALVHEAYLRLVNQNDTQWNERGHFLAVAAQIMRRILVDHARRHKSDKRGGPVAKLPLEAARLVVNGQSEDIMMLDDLLNRLARIDAKEAQIVELRFFGGLSVEETAAAMGVSPTTVKREWSIARKWLAREIGRSGSERSG